MAVVRWLTHFWFIKFKGKNKVLYQPGVQHCTAGLLVWSMSDESNELLIASLCVLQIEMHPIYYILKSSLDQDREKYLAGEICENRKCALSWFFTFFLFYFFIWKSSFHEQHYHYKLSTVYQTWMSQHINICTYLVYLVRLCFNMMIIIQSKTKQLALSEPSVDGCVWYIWLICFLS